MNFTLLILALVMLAIISVGFIMGNKAKTSDASNIPFPKKKR